ncbi:MAG: exodeoxyribonuclease V subunit alpha [Desulfuromonadales bacterium]|nr:MAG: exodeoxyribonuclease V subunit alpha [Desulfuromonadales bacterium]
MDTTDLELTDMDRHFADFVCRLADSRDQFLWNAAASVSNATGRGNVCLDLATARDEEGTATELERLRSFPVIGSPGAAAPLILDRAGRLYLHRYWEYEARLAAALLALGREECAVDEELLREGVRRLFPHPPIAEVDWQRIAALVAVCRRFAVISGGPGTGKTSTVVKVLALLVEQAAGERLHVALAAPTGKAAARLRESIRAAKEGLATSPAIRDRIPEEVATIHRLLGYNPRSGGFRHSRENPLPVDAVVVDEASMVDLPLMARLVDALPAGGRLILLGDKDQLASVEAGAVLGDICDTGQVHAFSAPFRERVERLSGERLPVVDAEKTASLSDSLVVLTRSYRFGGGSGIGELARLVNEGRGEDALALLKGEAFGDIRWHGLPTETEMAERLRGPVVAGYGEFRAADEPAQALEALGRFRILCAHRHGPYGVTGLNAATEQILGCQAATGGDWYPGRPVMVAENDYTIGLFNGDTGIILPDPDGSERLYAFFPDAAGGVRRHLPLRLPGHGTVFAMTVHKSQGSEFDRILVVLPDRTSEIVTRELIYTAVTRARHGVEIWGREELFVEAASRRVGRSSGLRDLLWG